MVAGNGYQYRAIATHKSKAFIAFLLVILVATLLYIFLASKRSDALPAIIPSDFKGPVGPPIIKGPDGPPPTPVFNPRSDVPNTTEVVSFTIEADDSGVFPNTISVKAKKIIEIIFRARKGIQSGGLWFASNYFDTGIVASGAQKAVTFVAPDKDFTFYVYSPNSNSATAQGQIVIMR